MELKKVFITLTSLFAASVSAGIFDFLEPDYQQASIKVVNKMDAPIHGVSIVHKYSDNYKNRGVWQDIGPHQFGNHAMDAEYHTGTGTTGRDWWYVTWFNSDFTRTYYSDPENFRELVDFLEVIGPPSISAAFQILAAAGAAKEGHIDPEEARKAGEALAKALTDATLNKESTVGYKQHILREEDAKPARNVIEIYEDKIRFISPSGNSETGVHWSNALEEEVEKQQKKQDKS